MAKAKTGDNTKTGKTVGKSRKFTEPLEAANNAIDAALLEAAKQRKSVMGPRKRSNPRASWLRGKMAVLRAAKAAKVPDKEIIEIFKSQGVEISLPTFRAFCNNANIKKRGKSSDKPVVEGQNSKPEKEKVDRKRREKSERVTMDQTEEITINGLTYEKWTFVFKRELSIRVTRREDTSGIKWSYASDELDLNCIHDTRDQAEMDFRYYFTYYWEKCSAPDYVPTLKTEPLKRKLQALVKSAKRVE
jgi:hypothetical protein